MPLRTSAAGRAALTAREGCRLNAYMDSVGVCTIGIGHSDRAPTGIKPVMGMCITASEADSILADDLVSFESAVNGAIKRPMTQPQFDACVSLAFNIGVGGFMGSTVVHRFNAGDVMGAADAFLMWEKPHELAQRRIGERAQFLTKDDPAVVSHPITPNPVVSHDPASVIDKPASADISGVRALQEALSDLGYYRGPVDASFGPFTETAVKGFQLAHGLAVDGVVGNATRTALDAAMVVRAAAAPPAPPPGLGRIPEPPSLLPPGASPAKAPPPPYRPPAVPGPHLVPAVSRPGFLARIKAAFGGKVA